MKDIHSEVTTLTNQKRITHTKSGELVVVGQPLSLVALRQVKWEPRHSTHVASGSGLPSLLGEGVRGRGSSSDNNIPRLDIISSMTSMIQMRRIVEARKNTKA